MSFGNHEYQHRFYRDTLHKKPAVYVPTNNILPLIDTSKSYVATSPVRYQSLASTNQINLRTRGGLLRDNEIGWQGYKMKSYVTDQYSRNYHYNALMLQKFRLQAEDYRRRLRFGPVHQRINNSRYIDDYEARANQIDLIYANQYQKLKAQELRRSLIINPQIIHQKNLTISRLQNYELQKSNMISRLQIENSQQKGKLKDYKKKYSKLKNKLQQQLLQQHKLKMQKNKANQVIAMHQEKEKLEDIQRAMSSISAGLQKNSQILTESLKLHNQIRKNNKYSLKRKQQIRILPSFRNNKSLLTISIQQKDVDAVSLDQQEVVPLLTPKVIYTKKKLQKQYKELDQLKRQIQTVNNRIKRLKTQ